MISNPYIRDVVKTSGRREVTTDMIQRGETECYADEKRLCREELYVKTYHPLCGLSSYDQWDLAPTPHELYNSAESQWFYTHNHPYRLDDWIVGDDRLGGSSVGFILGGALGSLGQSVARCPCCGK